jgi:MFS family permease
MLPVLDRERIVAAPSHSRWLVPPAALAVHLCIGQAYALSVFSLPMSRIVGVDHSAPGDWKLTTTVWIFNIAIFFLGASAAAFGKWVERSGPRKAMFASAVCFGGGFLVSALGVRAHQIALVYLGYGVLGGIGLGLGYISPVSTLIKWFPDRPGMATGLAIMGFGGGAMVGSPLAVGLMDRMRGPVSVGVWETFVVMGALYFAFMMFGAWTVRVPPEHAREEAGPAPEGQEGTGLTADEAIRTRSFWMLWLVLFTNVTAGIGVLGQASPMIQEMFGKAPAAAAGFVGLLSLWNLLGRFAWSSLSDRLGRRKTYAIYFGLGMALYALVPTTKALGNVALFVAAGSVIMSMYGGGFATIPAYLRDVFGTKQVGAIHGRLLTAWSMAGLVGPSIVTYARQAQVDRGVPSSDAYSTTMYGLACLLAVGFVCNLLVGRIHEHAHGGAPAHASPSPIVAPGKVRAPPLSLAWRWAFVAAPLAWGVWQVAVKSLALFR